jgi:hypothetical protein
MGVIGVLRRSAEDPQSKLAPGSGLGEAHEMTTLDDGSAPH